VQETREFLLLSSIVVIGTSFVTLLSFSGRLTRKFRLGWRLSYTSPHLGAAAASAVVEAVEDVPVADHVMSGLQEEVVDMAVVVAMAEVGEEHLAMVVHLPMEVMAEVLIQVHRPLVVAKTGGKSSNSK
jgi:hypothetical protein